MRGILRIKTQVESSKELTYPRLREHKRSGLVVLFREWAIGTVVVPADNFKLGQCYNHGGIGMFKDIPSDSEIVLSND